jgi:hypothetical protein
VVTSKSTAYNSSIHNSKACTKRSTYNILFQANEMNKKGLKGRKHHAQQKAGHQTSGERDQGKLRRMMNLMYVTLTQYYYYYVVQTNNKAQEIYSSL